MNDKRILLDLDDFKPELKKADPVAKASVEQLAKDSGFVARHAPAPKAKKEALAKPKTPKSAARADVDDGKVKRRGRKRSTNRNTQFTVKLKLETNNQIYDFAEMLECTAIAEVIELALGALQNEIEQGINPRERAVEQAAE